MKSYSLRSSHEIHEKIVKYCQDYGVPIYQNTAERGYDKEFPFLNWVHPEGRWEVSGGRAGIHDRLSYDEFINMLSQFATKNKEDTSNGSSLM